MPFQEGILTFNTGDNYVVAKYVEYVDTSVLAIEIDNPSIEPETNATNDSVASKSEPDIDLTYTNWELCSCINFIKLYYSEFLDVKLYSPRYLWNNASDYGLVQSGAIKGGLYVSRDNPYYWHIGIILEVGLDEIKVREKNLSRCRITERTLKIEDKIIVGFLKRR